MCNGSVALVEWGQPPFSVGPDALFVAYFASAEFGCSPIAICLASEVPAELEISMQTSLLTKAYPITINRLEAYATLAGYGISS
jgi:hypothetical protein